MAAEPTQTADHSNSPEVQNKAQTQPPTPKAKPKTKSAKASGPSESVNAIGAPVNWDKPENDPNNRTSIADDPTGESNTLQ